MNTFSKPPLPAGNCYLLYTRARFFPIPQSLWMATQLKHVFLWLLKHVDYTREIKLNPTYGRKYMSDSILWCNIKADGINIHEMKKYISGEHHHFLIANLVALLAFKLHVTKWHLFIRRWYHFAIIRPMNVYSYTQKRLFPEVSPWHDSSQECTSSVSIDCKVVKILAKVPKRKQHSTMSPKVRNPGHRTRRQ